MADSASNEPEITQPVGTVYVGAARFAPNAPAEHRGGLFRLRPDGSDWERLGKGLPDAPQVRAVVTRPDDCSVVYAGVHDGPYRSTDGGTTWQRLGFEPTSQAVWSFAFDPADHETMYLGVGPSFLYRSTNAGDTWSLLPSAAIAERLDMGFPTRLISIAIDPLDSRSIYAGVEVGGVMHSADGGDTWSDCSPDLIRLADEHPHLRSRLLSETELEGMLDTHALALSSAASGQVFLANRMGLFTSHDQGVTWSDLQVGDHSPLTYCREVKVSPHDPKVLFACFSDEAQGVTGSLYRSDNLGSSWHRFDRVTPLSTMMKVAFHPGSADEVWCATRDGEVFGTGDGGEHWTEHPLPAGGRDIYSICVA